MDRPKELSSTTYKFRVPSIDNAFYLTISNIEHNGKVVPYEIFINTKNLKTQAMIITLTRMISFSFRKFLDPREVSKELSSIYDPEGGWYEDGKYVGSIPSAISHLVCKHLDKLDKVNADKSDWKFHNTVAEDIVKKEKLVEKELEEVKRAKEESIHVDKYDKNSMKSFCPSCNEKELIMQSNCNVCLSCGYSKCG